MKCKTWTDIYKMKLGDCISPNDNTTIGITRVPGGWVYGDMHGNSFISFNNEFQEETK